MWWMCFEEMIAFTFARQNIFSVGNENKITF